MPVFGCNVCGTQLSADEAYVGKAVRCPTCSTVQTVPGDQVPVAAVADERPAASSSAATAPPPPRKPSPTGLSQDTLNAFRPKAGSGRRYGFNCQYCSSRLEATEDKAGTEGQCPTCDQAIIIPILDRYGRLIDPMTGKVVKQDPHPVHAYAAAGGRAPAIERRADGSQVIKCSRCRATNPISANNCKGCGMPFTMEGTTLDAAGGTNGFSVASLVLGIISIPAACTGLVPVLAIIFGIIGLVQSGDGGGRGMAIGGIVCGGIGLLLFVAFVS